MSALHARTMRVAVLLDGKDDVLAIEAYEVEYTQNRLYEFWQYYGGANYSPAMQHWEISFLLENCVRYTKNVMLLPDGIRADSQSGWNNPLASIVGKQAMIITQLPDGLYVYTEDLLWVTGIKMNAMVPGMVDATIELKGDGSASVRQDNEDTLGPDKKTIHSGQRLLE